MIIGSVQPAPQLFGFTVLSPLPILLATHRSTVTMFDHYVSPSLDNSDFLGLPVIC